MSSTSEPAAGRSAAQRLRAAVDVLLVWLIFACDGAWPIPDVNEAHYLTKAKHFWQPTWCERDPFLASADSHAAYFATFGLLTQFGSLPQAALVGRVVQWLLLAWGWRRLSYALVPRLGWAALSGAVMIALVERMNLAGEWLVGGCEAKSVAYALLFSALADVIGGRWNCALAQLGFATLFHVLVGGWSLIALGMVWCLLGTDRPPLRSLLPGLAAAALLAWGGLWPALKLSQGVDAATVVEANRIYVQERLSHHLLPSSFAAAVVARHVVLWGIWLFCLVRLPADSALRAVRLFVAAAGVIALGGTIITVLPVDEAARHALLRFYWFRLSDVLPAVGVALEVTIAAAAAFAARRSLVCIGLLFAVGVGHLAGVVVERTQRPLGRGENLGYDSNLPAWRDVCLWINRNTPPDAVVLSPRQFYTFKWYAERADAGTWKDVPQDARSIVAWRRRLHDLYGSDGSWVGFLPAEQVEAFVKRYGVTHIVAYRHPPLAYRAVYQNNDFVVYEMPASNEVR